MKHLNLILVGSLAPFAACAQTIPNPQIDSWYTMLSGRYARVVQVRGGQPTTTWPSPDLPNFGGGQTLPAYSDVQQVGYSAGWIYVLATGLASHQMGPWYVDVQHVLGNWPSNQNLMMRFSRSPRPATQHQLTGGGAQGLWVNGVAMFNMLDTFAWNSQTMRDEPSMNRPSAIWWRNAVLAEANSFDAGNAHQPPSGQYHYHDNPVALRAQLGDHVAIDPLTHKYLETNLGGHSKILGWADDGYPVYGPYGFANPNDPTSPIVRMRTGYILRNGQFGTTNLAATGRHSLGHWAAQLHNVAMQLAPNQFGPNVDQIHPLGIYTEDFDFLGDLGGQVGRDFDLDPFNGRFCKTPEYPNGTYAYFVTINPDGSPAYPYTIGRQFFGEASGGIVQKLTEVVTLARNAGPFSPTKILRLTRSGQIAITFSSVEGGHYKIEASDGTSGNWVLVAQDLRSAGLTTIYHTDAGYSGPSAIFRITLTSLEPYDVTGRPSSNLP
ncbi:MAG: YHYH protein [Armatimonadetes bacterium]|nr:YHYH protein [Armatimonadota bacterium]